jgi:hypothetical protein
MVAVAAVEVVAVVVVVVVVVVLEVVVMEVKYLREMVPAPEKEEKRESVLFYCLCTICLIQSSSTTHALQRPPSPHQMLLLAS